MTTTRKNAFIWLGLAIAAQAVMLMDPLTGWITDQFISDMITQGIVVFLLIYFFWIAGILAIRAFYKSKPSIWFSYHDMPDAKHLLAGLLLLILSVAITYVSWDGMKIYKELTGSLRNLGIGLGTAYFIAQYFYYFIEVILMTITIAFAQEAGEALFKPGRIPYGSVALAVLWGLDHILWHGLVDGLWSTFSALLYGLAYLAMRKNFKLSFLLILLMFIL